MLGCLLGIGLGIGVLAANDPPAVKLPPVTTICRAHGTTKCWTEQGESACKEGEVFRIVIAGADVETALAFCRRPPDEPRSQ
jgi:hypothetical protein